MNGPRAFPPLTAVTTALRASPPLIGLPGAHDPLAFIRNGDGIVGLGVALRLEFSGPSRLQDAAEVWRAIAANATVTDPVACAGTGLVAFGSFAFADESDCTSVLVVPSMIIGRHGTLSWVTRIGGGDSVIPDPHPSGEPFPSTFSPALMTEDGYLSAVGSTVRSITSGAARKVVVARDLVAQIPDDADLRLPIAALAAAYPDTFTFAVDGLIGSSPETLVRARGGVVSARVLAGSAARGPDPTSDARAAAALAESPKDLAEHAFALQSVLDSLGPRSSGLVANSRPFPLQLRNIWHLASDVTGALTDGSSALDLVAAMHPTAAVAGDPTDAALSLIAGLEPFDRGRYAGPVGWVDANGDGEWAIALRCAQVSPTEGGSRTVTAYAGAGIVAESDPNGELAETGLKFRPIVDAFRAASI
ncbi:MAG: isochorismate synthase [Rhodoglobus sp.]